MNRELRSYKSDVRISRAADGSKIVRGLIPYNSLSVDLGGFKELIAPGAFSEALASDSDVLALRDHDAKLLLGRTKSGTLVLEDSVQGLRYKLTLPNTTAGNDLAESVDRGDLDSTSFGFMCGEDDWMVTDDGQVIRTLKQVELFEVSPCSFPAYPDSNLSARSIPANITKELERRNNPSIDEGWENLKLRFKILSMAW